MYSFFMKIAMEFQYNNESSDINRKLCILTFKENCITGIHVSRRFSIDACISQHLFLSINLRFVIALLQLR